MELEHTDILICGGGVAGLTAAALFGSAGFDVICVDPNAPITDGATPGADLRTTAILQPGRTLLEQAGLWSALEAEAMPLEVMRVADASGPTPVIRDFDASDISDQPFGWNLRNWSLRRAMVARLEALPNVTLRTGTAFRGIVPRDHAAIVSLTCDRSIAARLVIGADGRNSAVRAALDIATRTTRYGQTALSFAVTHAGAHNNVSTEIHRSGGPFTLVPLPDHEGRPCSAVVWMCDTKEAEALAQSDPATFNAQATERSAGLYGPLTLVTGRQTWPIITQLAERFHGPRTALMAEAAHVLPPIGAQGLNTSLADLAKLHALATASPDTLGSPQMLTAYNRARHADAKLRTTGIDLLNRTSQTGLSPLQTLRSAGLRALHDITPIRKGLMRLGLGTS